MRTRLTVNLSTKILKHRGVGSETQSWTRNSTSYTRGCRRPPDPLVTTDLTWCTERFSLGYRHPFLQFLTNSIRRVGSVRTRPEPHGSLRTRRVHPEPVQPSLHTTGDAAVLDRIRLGNTESTPTGTRTVPHLHSRVVPDRRRSQRTPGRKVRGQITGVVLPNSLLTLFGDTGGHPEWVFNSRSYKKDKQKR